jgi:beta propeller repeat protein
LLEEVNMRKLAGSVVIACVFLSLIFAIQVVQDSAIADVAGTEINLSNDTNSQGEPAIWGSRVVWAESIMDDGSSNWEIFLYDLSLDSDSNGTPNFLEDPRPEPDLAKIRITYNISDQLNPEIYGDIIVWEDNRHGNFDIYMYDLAEDTDDDTVPNYLELIRPDPDPAEIRITEDPAHQEDPAIYGSKIVWVDKRNGNKDIFIYDIISGEEIILAGQEETGDPKYRAKQDKPDIYGDKVVWVDDGYSAGSWEICMYTISVDTDGDGIPNYMDEHRPVPDPAEERITSTSESENSPCIYQNFIAYVRSNNVFLNDLNTNEEFQLTTSSISQVIDGNICDIHGSKVVWAYDEGAKDLFVYDLALDTDSDDTPNYRDDDTLDPDPAISQVTNESETISMVPTVFLNKIVWHDSRNSTRDIYIFVLTENLPPEITDFSPDYIPEILDTGSFNFTITATDPELGTLTYTWFVDSQEQTGEDTDSFELLPKGSTKGTSEIKVVVSDGEYSTEKIWQISIIETNVAPPIIIEIDPVFNPSYVEGKEVTFGIRAKDEDSSVLGFAWYKDEGLIHIQSYNLTSSGEVYGEFTHGTQLDETGSDYTENYNITIEVRDGKFSATYTWTVTVLFFTDADMDGYSDSLEKTMGSDPMVYSDTPLDTDSDLIVDTEDDDKDGDGLADEHDTEALDPEKQLDGQPDYSVEIMFIIITVVLLVAVLIILSRRSR